MPLRFGTDGIRGVANVELTAELALSLGRAAARVLPGTAFLVGRDTRRSGPMLAAALAAGLAAEGRDVVDVGVVPTPGLAWLAGNRQLPAAMISASHNPYADNGIKLLGPGGTKLSVDTEQAVQQSLDALFHAGVGAGAGSAPGSITDDHGSTARYADWLVGLGGVASTLEGTVVVDCANGAASAFAPAILSRLGIAHEVIGAEPDGENINAGCGSTELAPLSRAVVDSGAVAGLAFDGDADRLLAVDHLGRVVDGDHLIALFAKDLRSAGRLPGDRVVVTVMSNLGLRLSLAAAGIEITETPVGDRHVADALESGGLALGGEQSGHLIFRDHAATGDGMLTAVKLLDLLARAHRPLAELADEAMERLPQVLVNVPVAAPSRLEGAEAVWAEVRAVEAELGATGRVLLRPSGTESCVRVMVEAPSETAAADAASRLAEAVRVALA